MSGWQDLSSAHGSTARGSCDVARGPGNGTFLSTLDSPSRFPGGSPARVGVASSPGGWWVIRVPTMGAPLPPLGLARAPGVSGLAVGLFSQEEHIARRHVGQRQAGPQGRFCSFLSLHTPEEDSEVTWQPGKFLPPPSALVALACLQGSLSGTNCWVGNKPALAPGH